jgi:Protein of unknown function, DUF481
MRAAGLCVLAALAWPGPARAQSADDVASRIATVARTMSARSTRPWTLDATFTADMSRGNADTTNLRTTVIPVMDTDDWRLGAYLSAAYATTDGETANERAGANLAVARRFGPVLTVAVIEEVVRAPLDGLAHRNLLGSVAVWTPPARDGLQLHLYGGAGWAAEHDTDSRPDRNYGAGLFGASATAQLSPTATLTLAASLSQDLASAARYILGSSVALESAVTAVLGVRVSYALSYTGRPVGRAVRATNALSGGLTLSLKGR